MKEKFLGLLFLAGSATAHPPPPDSLPYVPPPPFVDIDSDDVLQKVLKGIWETQPNAPLFRLKITGWKPHHFKIQIQTQPYCKALLIGRFALMVESNYGTTLEEIRAVVGSMGFSAIDHVEGAEIALDGDRKKTNCLGMPARISFKFGSPPNHWSARVIVRQQFKTGPDETEYEMTRRQ